MDDMEEFLRKNYFWEQAVYVAQWENEVCRMCRKAISGAAFKYMGTDLFFHLSCLNAPTNEKALMIHFGNPRHDRLILREEVKNDGKEDVICFGCEKPVLGPGYKCSTSQCNLLIHKSCFELPPQIQHPFHPNHTLLLVKRQKKHCNACGRNCNAYPFYRCSECDFNLDFACATRSRIKINADDCQHSFISFLKQNQFTCEACGEEGQELAFLCSICQLLIHTKCGQFPRTIWITRHGHSLALTYSLPDQLKEHNNIFCNLCYQQVRTKYAAYYCQKCNYVAHLACAFKFEESVHLTWLPKESVDLATDDMEVKGAGKMQHFSHEHDLILSNEELVEDKLCDGCMGLISNPFYNCTQCDFFLHSRCALLPTKKQHLLHQHQLTLNSLQARGIFVHCDACERDFSGFTYRCDMCDFDLDLQCCSIPKILKHEGHQHSLFLAINSSRRCRVCNCTSNKTPGIFVCTNCDFALGLECATLPLVARHKYDDHLFKLTYNAEANCEESYCLICEKERDPNLWFYYCAKCDFPAHTQCVLGKYHFIKFGSTFTSRRHHQHPLTYVSKTNSSPPCDGCGKTFDGMALECTQCKFNVHCSTWCLQKITKKVTWK